MTKQSPPSFITAPASSSLLGPLPSLGNGTSFKSGSQLPSISNDKKPTSSLFPPASSAAKKQEYEDEEEDYEQIDGYTIPEIIEKIAKSKVKDYKSLTNKTLFKFMDMIDM